MDPLRLRKLGLSVLSAFAGPIKIEGVLQQRISYDQCELVLPQGEVSWRVVLAGVKDHYDGRPWLVLLDVNVCW
jgi:hypothetical protein